MPVRGEHRFDCVVVGAGPAGIAAGQVLHDAGADFVVFEAGDEIGGRARTGRLADGTPYERGAMVLHGLRIATWEYVLRHGLTTDGAVYHDYHSGHYVEGGTWGVDPPQNGAIERLRDLLLSPQSDGRSLLDVVRGCGTDLATQQELLHVMDGLTPLDPATVDAVSAGEVLVRDGPGTALFSLVEGYSELWRRISEPFGDHIQLCSAIRVVEWSPSGVVIQLPGAPAIRATSAIITPSLGVLQAGGLDFRPPLPADKLEAIAGLRMAPLIKVTARFRDAIWEAHVGDALSFASPDAAFFDHWFPTHARRAGPAVLVSLVGDRSTQITGDPGGIRAAASADLVAAFGSDAVDRELLEIMVDDWPSDPLALGAVSTAPVGHRYLRARLAEPTPPLFWAGEACAADGHAECVEGALVTGRTAAIEALHLSRAFRVHDPESRLDYATLRE
jgi:monoamine oxidase